jgi:hypothetical protein
MRRGTPDLRGIPLGFSCLRSSAGRGAAARSLHASTFVRAAGHVPVDFAAAARRAAVRPVHPAEALRQLDDLRAKNLITDEEYQAKRKAILDRL